MSTLASYLGPELASQLPPANHTNPETHVTTMLGVEISLTILMVIFVSMRFYSRLFINGLFGLDDATMGLAAATAVGHTLVTCAGTAHGIGFHLWDVDPDSIPAGFKPINLFWNQPFSIQRDCVDVLTLLVATAALNSLGDLLVYLWPIKFLFKLQMPLAHRLGLILLFSFGCVVFAASICRIVSLPPAMTSVDVLYNSSTLLLIASIEENVGIICGCLPCVKGTLAHFWPRIFRSTDHRSYSPDNTPNSIGGGGGRHNNSSSRRNRRDHYHHTGPGRVTGYGDHSHNHSATVVSLKALKTSHNHMP
ncbi:putative integral membrane protein pth11 [Diplodia seriata]|uniref:Putative integral membrane protein pth11 n=1 Tax=Diplodia seriata TaxID=420778 RepID=A0A0G2EUR7_9PEZI|nr:putative integral membrane protein pth11 [Diplodia seriata]